MLQIPTAMNPVHETESRHMQHPFRSSMGPLWNSLLSMSFQGAPSLEPQPPTSKKNQQLLLDGTRCLGTDLSDEPHIPGIALRTWVVVKVMAPFWFPLIVRHLIFRVPPKKHNFDNPPHEGTGLGAAMLKVAWES